MKYDTNGSGKLERAQVIRLLTDTDTSTPPGTEPSEECVEFMMKVADKERDEAIAIDELEELMTVWVTFADRRHEFEEKLLKYDTSKTGKLSKDEVRCYLSDLNGGKLVTDEELEAVFNQADVLQDGNLNTMELKRATALWYGYVESNGKNCCCVVS